MRDARWHSSRDSSGPEQSFPQTSAETQEKLGSKRFLVTGCAGFIGSHLTEALLATGCSVIGLDNFTNYYPRELKEANIACARDHDRFNLIEADLSIKPPDDLVRDVDGVFHLAARPGVRRSWGQEFDSYLDDNVLATQRVLEACARERVKVVFASSSSVYGNAEAFPTPESAICDPVSPYGITKLACESLASAYAHSEGLDIVSLRYFTVYGPRQRPDMAFTRIMSALASGSEFTMLGSGRQSRDFTYVEDAVAATIGAFQWGRRGAIYNVGGGAEASMKTIIRTCEEIAGRALRVRCANPSAGDVFRTVADTSRARADFGWRPETSLRAGLQHHFEWTLKQLVTCDDSAIAVAGGTRNIAS